MARTLSQRLEVSRIKREIAENTHKTRVFNFINENLQYSRKRKLGWTSPGSPDRDFSKGDRFRAMAMARQRVEENPVAVSIVRARLNNICGKEYRLMMRSGDAGWDVAVENWWTLEKDRLDVSGRRTWGQLLRMWQARRDVDGDAGIAMLDEQYENRPLSYVQTFEADQIQNPDSKEPNDPGIDFDDFGMPVRYHVVSDPNDLKASKKQTFARENFILFRNDPTERVNRARGMSLFLQSLSIGQDHTDIMDAITQLVKSAAFIGLKFRMDADEDGNPFGAAGGTETAENGVDYSKVKLVPGTNIVLGEGEDVDVLESKNPTEQVQSFEKILLSRLLLPFGLTYELLTGDYSALNDRTARVAQKQFEKLIRPEQAALGIVATRIFRWALSRAVNAGELTPPPKVKNTWFNHSWGKPGFPYINILQEAQAHVLLLEKGLTSRTKILGEQGDDDFDDLMDEIEYEQGVIKSRGVNIVSVNGYQDTEKTEETDAQSDHNGTNAP
jgi:capsid protein